MSYVIDFFKCVLFDLENVRFEMESVLFDVESVRCGMEIVLFGLETVLIKVEMVYRVSVKLRYNFFLQFFGPLSPVWAHTWSKQSKSKGKIFEIFFRIFQNF